MGIKDGWKDTENILGNDYDNRHSCIRWRTCPIHNAFLSSVTFSNATAIAKPIRKSNPVKRIVALDYIADI